MAWKTTVVTAATQSTSARSSRKLCEMISGIRTPASPIPKSCKESSTSQRRDLIFSRSEDPYLSLACRGGNSDKTQSLHIGDAWQDFSPEQFDGLHQAVVWKQA